MNVTCPQCSTIFRVDPAKVPEQGVRARCSVCSGLIAVRRPPVAAPVLPPPAPVPFSPPPPPPPPPTPPAPVPYSPPPATRPPEPPPPVAPPQAPPAPVPVAEPAPASRPPERETFAAAQPAAPPPPPTRGSPAARTGNPFMQQDPSTRARRLARALVSDLVVYYPEKRQRGLAEGNLKELFAEEIRKSWEEYSEQVGDEIAANTPYFTEALNEILAEGRALFG